MDDKDTSSFDTMVETATSAIGEAAISPVVPTQATEEEALAEQPNEQMLVEDAAIAPEAVPAPIAPKKTTAKKRKKKSAKQVPQPAAKKSKTAAPKKTAKKSAKKSKIMPAVKKKTAKKVAKKKAKKSKR